MWLNRLSTFINRYRGLPILIAVGLVALNLVLNFFSLGWLTDTDILLHIGIIVGLIGVLLAEALR